MPNLKLRLTLHNLPVLLIQLHYTRMVGAGVDVFEECGECGFFALGFSFDLVCYGGLD